MMTLTNILLAARNLTQKHKDRTTMDFPFRTLQEAREQWTAVQAEVEALRGTAANANALAAEKETLQAEVGSLAGTVKELKDQIVSLEKSVSDSRTENAGLQSSLEEQKTKVSTLEKNAKTVKAQARELVAASAGQPLAIGSLEEKPELAETDFPAAMVAEKDPVKLKALYDEYNKRFRPDKK